MCDCANTLEQLALEPGIPLLALSDFLGGNQLPTWDIAEKGFEMKKQDAALPLLLNVWKNNDATDLVLKLGTQQHRCSRLRFMCYSDYALRELISGQRELVLPQDQVSPAGLERVCEWIRKPVALLERHNILQMLEAAMFLEIDLLVKQVWYCLGVYSEFSEDQAFVVCSEALLLTRLPVVGLDKVMLQRIKCFFLTLVASVDFVRLPFEQVHYLLSSNHVAVNSEKEIFFTAVRWLIHDWPKRAKHLPNIMESVRLVLLPRQFLIQLMAPTDEPVLNLFRELPEFQQMISKA